MSGTQSDGAKNGLIIEENFHNGIKKIVRNRNKMTLVGELFVHSKLFGENFIGEFLAAVKEVIKMIKNFVFVKVTALGGEVFEGGPEAPKGCFFRAEFVTGTGVFDTNNDIWEAEENTRDEKENVVIDEDKGV